MRPLSLTDRQLDIISETARAQRFAAMVGQRSGRITDASVAEAAQLALASLTQNTAA